MNLTEYLTPIGYFGYEQAYPTNLILEDSSEEAEPTIITFCKALENSGHFRYNLYDNKIVLICETNRGTNVFVQWHDNDLKVGLDVRPYRGATLPRPLMLPGYVLYGHNQAPDADFHELARRDYKQAYGLADILQLQAALRILLAR